MHECVDDELTSRENATCVVKERIMIYFDGGFARREQQVFALLQ